MGGVKAEERASLLYNTAIYIPQLTVNKHISKFRRFGTLWGQHASSRQRYLLAYQIMPDFDNFLTSLRQQPTYVKAFEVFVKWFLKNDPEWSTEVDEVWLWEDWPDRWGPDCGLDLVFRHRNGDIWAVQVKCFDPSSSISKRSIDRFLSESGISVIDKRLLIASTDRISANAKRVCTSEGKDKSVTLHPPKDFQAAAVHYPKTYADLPKAGPKPKPTPRDHQLEAIDAVAQGFETHNRGQMIMACGIVKTFAEHGIRAGPWPTQNRPIFVGKSAARFSARVNRDFYRSPLGTSIISKQNLGKPV